MEQKLGFMDKQLAFRLIDEIANFSDVALVPFFRGETLLHPEWKKIISYAKSRNISPIQIATNGSLLTSEASRFIICEQVDFISFSLDTIDPELYQKSRRGSDYNVVLENILRFLQIRKEMNLKKPEVQVSAVETFEHKPGMNEFIKFWRKRVDRVRVYTEHSVGDSPGEITSGLPALSERLPCMKPFEDMVILWNGEVALCNHDWTREREAKIADVKLKGSIEKAWNSERYKEIRSAHLNKDVPFETVCEKCDHWKLYYLDDKFIGRLYQDEKPGVGK